MSSDADIRNYSPKIADMGPSHKMQKDSVLAQLSWKTPFLEEKIASFFLENTMNPAFDF